MLINLTIQKSRIGLINPKIQTLKYTELSAYLRHYNFKK